MDAGVEKLRALLTAHGFDYDAGHDGSASGGPFAISYFRRGSLEIALIVRNRTELGCPNYSEGKGFAGHSDMVWALGYEGKAQLVSGEWLSFVAKDGGNPFDALRADLELLVLPALQESESTFRLALRRAVKKFQESLGFRARGSPANQPLHLTRPPSWFSET
jgi:hypothetical protein